MAQIPVLWPALRVDAVTPAAILRVQAASLEKLTNGILIGQVVGGEKGADEYLHLEVHAPALQTTERLLTVVHPKRLPYPASVEWNQGPMTVASNDTDLEGKIAAALRSDSIQSAVHSLIARSNELLAEAQGAGEETRDAAVSPAIQP